MRRIIYILLFIPLFCQAQENFDAYISAKPAKERRIITPLMFAGSVVANGIADGLRDDNNKMLSHTLYAVSISMLLFEPILNKDSNLKWWERGLTYGFIRFALFDYSYNLTRGLPLNYYGSTSFWDKNILGVIKAPDGLIMLRVPAIIVGFAIPLNHGKYGD